MQYLVCGLPYAFWIFTYKNAGGAILGGFVASRIGEAVGGGLGMFLVILLGIAIGLIITLDRRGFIWFRRWAIVIAFYLRRATGSAASQTISSAAFYEISEIREQPIIIRKAGQTIVTSREHVQ
ncbi:MAG TPA: hypothetical protein VD886_17765 [Herpetosiphonaceae bacterium]|nr:hypothetical protein [Herpetosiphonaceae bacterium]